MMTTIEAEENKDKRQDIRRQSKTPTRFIHDRVETHELRRISYVGGKGKYVSQQHFYNISVPKSFVRELGLGKGDMFMWRIAKRSPLTFTLTQVNFKEEND